MYLFAVIYVHIYIRVYTHTHIHICEFEERQYDSLGDEHFFF